MQQRPSEVAVRHLEPVIDRPERRAKAVAHSRESAARCGVGLEHHELLPGLLRGGDRGEVLCDEVPARRVREVVREHILRVYRGAEACVGERGGAVVIWVLLDREDRDTAVIAGDEACVEDGLQRPRALQARCDEVAACGDRSVVVDRVYHDAKLVKIVRLVVILWPVPVPVPNIRQCWEPGSQDSKTGAPTRHRDPVRFQPGKQGCCRRGWTPLLRRFEDGGLRYH